MRQIFIFAQDGDVNLSHIESRLSKSDKAKYEFYVDCKAETKEKLQKVIDQLREKATYLHVLNKESEVSKKDIDAGTFFENVIQFF